MLLTDLTVLFTQQQLLAFVQETVITTAKVPGIKTYEPHVPCS